MRSQIMFEFTNDKGYTVSCFYSRYGFKQQGTTNMKIVFEGTVLDLPPEHRGEQRINSSFKYVRVWKR